jgi:hypothetical protein
MQKKGERKVNEFILEIDDSKKDVDTLRSRLGKVSEYFGQTAKNVKIEQMLVLSTTVDASLHQHKLYISLFSGVDRKFFV